MTTIGCPKKEIYTAGCQTVYMNETLTTKPFRYIGKGTIVCKYDEVSPSISFKDTVLYECEDYGCYFKYRQVYLLPSGWVGYSYDKRDQPSIDKPSDNEEKNAGVCAGGIILSVFFGLTAIGTLIIWMDLLYNYIKSKRGTRPIVVDHPVIEDNSTIARVEITKPQTNEGLQTGRSSSDLSIEVEGN